MAKTGSTCALHDRRNPFTFDMKADAIIALGSRDLPITILCELFWVLGTTGRCMYLEDDCSTLC